MGTFIKTVIRTAIEFLASPVRRRLLFLCVLGLIALIEFFALGFARRTFVFYTVDGENIYVEDRMLKHSRSKEENIARYTEETLLGPVSPDLLPLFPLETKLKSILYRNKVVYINFTETAALPPIFDDKGRKTLDNFHTLYESILRNFSYVRDVRFFIDGNSVLMGMPEHEFDNWPAGYPVDFQGGFSEI